MLKIADLKTYAADIMNEIESIKSFELAVTKFNLSKFMQKHRKDMNMLMLVLIPEHDMTGSEDNARWENTVGFYFLEKTNYSEHDHEGYLSIFERTQQVAKEFVDKLLNDKADNTGLFCGFLAFLDENSISVTPIVAIDGCNGYYLEISMKSNV